MTEEIFLYIPNKLIFFILLVADQNINEGEVLFSIPRSSVLNVKNVLGMKAAGTLNLDEETLNSMPSWLVWQLVFSFNLGRQD